MIGEILQLLVLALALVAYFRYARRLKGSLYLIFTALSSATLLLSLTYYLAHTYIREGMRVPFAANDIADFGTFLLMSTALCSAVGTEWGRFRGVTAGAAVFAAANTCLWIGWSGEWVRDILGGLSFGYFICVCIRSVYLTHAMSRWERILMWVISSLLIAAETGTFFVPAGPKALLDGIGTALMLVGEALLLVRLLLALRPGKSCDGALSLAFLGLCWNNTSMYMSADPVYTVFSNLMTLHLLLMLLAVRKKVREA